jgi:glucose/arabinose dehydrogenase
MRRHALVVLALLTGLVACAEVGADTDATPAPSVTFAPLPSTTTITPAATTTLAATEPGSAPATDAPTTTAAPSTTTTTIPLTAASVRFTPLVALEQPVALAWRTGDERLYIVEQDGRVTSVLPGGSQPMVVLDITDLTSSSGEQGLLGLAFSPDGAHAYVNYTDAGGDTVIAEYAVPPGGTFDVGSRRELLVIDQPYGNHNGGHLVFGPDGMLYIGTGDGGSGGDPERRALNASGLLGKLLRIDPTPSADLPYTVPADNPFIGVAGARGEIWSVGLRNPWKFSFDRATGDLWIADVGQNAIEEVSVSPATGGRDAGRGVSFGWSAYEGSDRYNADQPADGHLPPAHTYPHGDDCSISGSATYRGTSIASLVGWYVYGDYCSGRVWALQVVSGVEVANIELGRAGQVVAVAEGPQGELYVLDHGGDVLRIDPA